MVIPNQSRADMNGRTKNPWQKESPASAVSFLFRFWLIGISGIAIVGESEDREFRVFSPVVGLSSFSKLATVIRLLA